MLGETTMTTPFQTYISNVEADYRGDKATEYTYRGSLEIFMEALEHGVEASSDPKHIECGAPDFIVEKRRVPLGYVETKDVGEPLDRVEKSDQMKRYLKALHNLILTDYVEFRWYVNGEKKRTVRLAEFGKNKRLVVAEKAEQNITELFHDFYATETPTVNTAKELAGRLANVTHFIRDVIVDVMKSGEPSLQKSFDTRFNAFKELLLPALKIDEFADLYAQTMTYGLFAAKLAASEEPNFTLLTAANHLFGNKFLRRLFLDVSEELDEIEIIRPYLLDIVSLLNRANFKAILADFGKRTRTEDPVVHFYETFLASYDPKLRESRGVYYTPEPGVQFIVNAVHYLLQTRFNLPWGLADGRVKLLDPATGTGTFLFYVILKIYEEVVTNRKQAGQWKQKSKELLNRIFGFELLIAPYVVSHLKLGLLLKTLDAPLEGRDERFHVFLTNTLEEGVTRAEQLSGMGYYIAEEASDAAFVKKQQEIVVVLGNPPYSGHSANASIDKDGNPNFIGKLLREYYFVDGAPLGERNPKWLQDDYVKFIRFGEWRIDKTGHGILAFITNHGYLDNPTFRGMRQHLMNTFDEIYVFDLHGNSKKKEKAPDGSKDENVFDIQQGVAIFIGIKQQANSSSKSSKVFHADLWGLREQKYAKLQTSNLNEISWKELNPERPYYLFEPRDTSISAEYDMGWMITSIFGTGSSKTDPGKKYGLGICTHNDLLFVNFSKNEVSERVRLLANPHVSDQQILNELPVQESPYWNTSRERAKVRKTNWQENVLPVYYRPFDWRYIYYEPALMEIGRGGASRHVMANARNSPLNLLLPRGYETENFEHVLVSNGVTVHHAATRKEGHYVFPLYSYTTPESTAGTLFAQLETTRQPNLSPVFISTVSEKLGLQFANDGPGDLKNTFGPEDVFHYIYAVLHSSTYRTRYAEFLKTDFPRVPLTGDKKLFTKLVMKGKELADLHLFKSTKLDNFITGYPTAGSNKVEKINYVDGCIYINDHQSFCDVPDIVWNFTVGGYQVCEKWLKDRKGRVLSAEDIDHYQRVIVALNETIRLMDEIDKTITRWPIE
jgi:type I restriction-modification system DNA methylase subunit